ncbi:MAG: 50S ribosomal protein L6 [Chitinispirillaceae bacterium]|nr:50S ribosomal protein L6 [Chitinispirillaceae bacterium]
MSRIGKLPVAIPPGVKVKIDGQKVEVTGSKGTISRVLPPDIRAEVRESAIHIAPVSEDIQLRPAWGLNRVLISNIVTGVHEGYKKVLEITGVGYKADMKGKDLSISVGYSQPRLFKATAGITFSVEGQTRITVQGIDKEKVGEIAAEIRKIRKPDPYKGKGIKYAGEHIRRKAGKAAGK